MRKRSETPDKVRSPLPKTEEEFAKKCEKLEEEYDKFFDEHGYDPNFEEHVISMLKGKHVSEEGLKELWNWYCRELWRPTEPGGSEEE